MTRDYFVNNLDNAIDMFGEDKVMRLVDFAINFTAADRKVLEQLADLEVGEIERIYEELYT